MASLKVLRSDEDGGTFQLDATETLVGRDEDCDVRIDGLGLSRRHCAITRQADRFFIRDLASENGTWVNGERVTECELRNGDQVGLGLQASLRFRNESEATIPEPTISGPAPTPAGLPPVSIETGDERPMNRWLVAVILIAVLALIAAMARFSFGG